MKKGKKRKQRPLVRAAKADQAQQRNEFLQTVINGSPDSDNFYKKFFVAEIRGMQHWTSCMPWSKGWKVTMSGKSTFANRDLVDMNRMQTN